MTFLFSGQAESQSAQHRTTGEQRNLDAPWRDVFNYGFFMGPRIFASGSSVGVAAGHRGSTPGYDGVAEIRKAVRLRAAQDVNLIKLSGDVELLDDEVAAVTETAAWASQLP